jgi:hypothetical protein
MSTIGIRRRTPITKEITICQVFFVRHMVKEWHMFFAFTLHTKATWRSQASDVPKITHLPSVALKHTYSHDSMPPP